MREINRGLLLIITLIFLIASAEEGNMDITNINNYLQKRDMKYIDIDKYRDLYGATKKIILDDGSKIYLSIGEKDLDEIHYFADSSLNNQYRYDERGRIQFKVSYFGNIELYRVFYDSMGNILSEEKGAVLDAAFSLEKVKELMKKVYNVNLDTLAQRSIFYHFEDILEKKSVYTINISPPEKSLAEQRTIVIDGDTGEIISDELIFGEY